MKGIIHTENGPVEVGNTHEEQLLIEQLVEARKQIERMSAIMDQCDVLMGKNNSRMDRLKNELYALLVTTGLGGFVMGLLFARIWWNV